MIGAPADLASGEGPSPFTEVHRRCLLCARVVGGEGAPLPGHGPLHEDSAFLARPPRPRPSHHPVRGSQLWCLGGTQRSDRTGRDSGLEPSGAQQQSSLKVPTVPATVVSGGECWHFLLRLLFGVGHEQWRNVPMSLRTGFQEGRKRLGGFLDLEVSV